jgi:prepilin-type processing-associated H-X9-DG protein
MPASLYKVRIVMKRQMGAVSDAEKLSPDDVNTLYCDGSVFVDIFVAGFYRI